jgi:succinoglycan biosynthesis transport protein ExoP
MNAPVPGLRTPLFELLKSEEALGGGASDLIDFSSLFATLWRGRIHLLATGAFCALLAGGWAGFVAEPKFRATSVLVMAPQESLAPTGLDSVVPGLGGESVAVNTEVEVLRSRALLRRLAVEMQLTRVPEFNPTLRPRPAWAEELERLLATLHPPLAERTEMPALTATVNALQERVAVRNIPDSRVFELTVESADAARAADIANGLARLHLGQQIALKQEEAARASDWLSDRVAELQVDLEAADSRANAFAAEMELVDAETLQALAAQLKEIRQRIASRRADLAARNINAARADAQLGPLIDMEENLSSQLARQSQDLVRLGQLRLEAEASRVIYEHFLARLKEASVQRGIQKPDSRILSEAEVPIAPASPQPVLAALLAGMLGLLAAAVRLLSREARAEGFRTAAELEAMTGQTVLGQIPRLSQRRRDLAEHMAKSPGSFAAESVRQLRTALHLTGPALPQVVLVTSSVPGEGKSTLARALGHNLAALGKRVLVIEADIRRRRRLRVFRGEPAPGLLTVLEGKTRFEEAVNRVETLGIDVLPGGQSRRNAADLLSSENFAQLIETARARYDSIVIDSPPVLVVPDARLLGRASDRILYVVGWDSTTRRQLQEGLRALETVQLSVGGLVLSKIDPKGLRRYGHGTGFAAYAAGGYYEA